MQLIQLSVGYCASKEKTFMRKVEMIHINGTE